MKRISALSLLVVAASYASADEAMYWNQVALQAIKGAGQPPPMVARNLAIASIAQADAVNSINGLYPSYAYNGAATVAGASKEAAVAAAAYNTLKALMPNQAAMLDQAWASRSAAWGTSAQALEGVRLGTESAQAMLSMRSTDGAAQANYAWTGGTDPGQWRPTGPDFKNGVLPGWGSVQTFGIASGSTYRPSSLVDLTSQRYATDYNEVALYGSKNSSLRTLDQTDSVNFWAAGGGTVTPPGMWNQVAQKVGQQSGNSLEQNVRMFGMLNMALADAGIVAWDTKYAYNMWRPETAITNGESDGNAATTAIAGWQPYMTTPNHPSCVSGHSTFSSAGATVLASFFGRDQMDFSFTSEGSGTTRQFSSFSEAAMEAGRSRIYGGIHFEFDNQIGLDLGRQVGASIGQNGIAAVPEPATMAALGLGVAGLLKRRRRESA